MTVDSGLLFLGHPVCSFIEKWSNHSK